MTTMISEIRSIPLTALVLSDTRMQLERRAMFNQEALQELAGTIKLTGRVEHAITVRLSPFREVEEERYEIADGERRYLASQMAGLTEILAEVRDLSDEQVEQIQIVTGLQKEGLHELVEAEGYDTLMKRGLSVDEIAAKCVKSKRTVYARLQLLKLQPDVREMFRKGEIDYSKAFLVARIPVPSLQREAAKRFKDWSYREARDRCEHEYMLHLAQAPFPTEDANLLKNTPACGRCPKRTGNQPELFEDVKGADVCTDRTCYQAKCEAGAKLKLALARASGQRVISGAEAKRVKPWSHSSQLASGYAEPSDICCDDPKRRTYAQILGKDHKPAVLQDPHEHGAVLEVVEKADALKKLKADGLIKPAKRSTSTSGVTGASILREKKVGKEFERRLFLAVHAKAPKKLSQECLVQLADNSLEGLYYEADMIEDAWGWKDVGSTRELEKLTEPQLHQLLFEIAILRDGDLEPAAKKLKIDAGAIRKAIAAEQKPKKPKKPAKASKKKAKHK